MLSLSSSSSCDICFETYRLSASSTDEIRRPSSIDCGHVFCTPCIDALESFICPICRSPFDRHSVRRLYVTIDPPSDPQAPRERSAAGSMKRRLPDRGSDDAAEKAWLKDRLIAIATDSSPGHVDVEEYLDCLQRAGDWLTRNGPGEHKDLRALYKLHSLFLKYFREHNIALLEVKDLTKRCRELRDTLASTEECARLEIEEIMRAFEEAERTSDVRGERTRLWLNNSAPLESSSSHEEEAESPKPSPSPVTSEFSIYFPPFWDTPAHGSADVAHVGAAVESLMLGEPAHVDFDRLAFPGHLFL